jgi:rubrerythrin
MQSKKFQRRIEDFVCEKCGTDVKGNGYTDHCPACLWGKHVDVNPGDRAANCGGLMEPISIDMKNTKYTIHYVCMKCNFKFQVKSLPKDDFEVIIKLVSKPL